MRKQRFGSFEPSVIALGTGDFGGKCPEGQAREYLDAYMEIGGNIIDTARVYGDFVTPKNGESEKVIGRWMADRRNRDSIFLSTKGGHPPLDDMRKPRLGREEIRCDMAQSLDALRTDHVEVYWLHRDDESRMVGEIMETLQSLLEDGSAKMIGVSNWTTERILAANAYAHAHGLTPLSANQPQFSLAVQKLRLDPTLVTMDAKMWQMHRKTQMVLCAFSSQARGYFMKLDAGGREAISVSVRAEFDSPENEAILQRIRRLQSETGHSVSAIGLAYVTSQPFPSFALAGVSSLKQLEALREAGEITLSEEQVRGLREMDME
ncbi:MAG: aldo/keto reductase [Clostridia bacterium]|nr:aldo/keto reductase [Clostridia bacterium]